MSKIKPIKVSKPDRWRSPMGDWFQHQVIDLLDDVGGRKL